MQETGNQDHEKARLEAGRESSQRVGRPNLSSPSIRKRRKAEACCSIWQEGLAGKKDLGVFSGRRTRVDRVKASFEVHGRKGEAGTKRLFVSGFHARGPLALERRAISAS